MKIGILTQPLHNNYGGLLQNYALQQVLTKLGHNVETIDWEGANTNYLHKQLSRLILKVLSIINPHKYKKPEYIPTSEEFAVIRRETDRFINKYIKHTSVIHSEKGFKNIACKNNYNAFVVGSDQCWRPAYNPFLREMFLSFVADRNDIKRIAFAASFGTDQWIYTPEQTKDCSFLAQKFDLITVRENSGIKLCKDYLKVDAVHVLDPTMLLAKEDYEEIVHQENESKSPGELFYYILDPTKEIIAKIDSVARGKGVKPFTVLPKYQAENRNRVNVKKNIEDCVYPGVTAWLRAFMDAKMTVVDSFHGTVFSILFNKPFWVIGNKDRGLSRFYSLLQEFGLERRLTTVEELTSLNLDDSIDWVRVNNKLQELREECTKLLSLNLR